MIISPFQFFSRSKIFLHGWKCHESFSVCFKLGVFGNTFIPSFWTRAIISFEEIDVVEAPEEINCVESITNKPFVVSKLLFNFREPNWSNIIEQFVQSFIYNTFRLVTNAHEWHVEFSTKFICILGPGIINPAF